MMSAACLKQGGMGVELVDLGCMLTRIRIGEGKRGGAIFFTAKFRFV